MSSQALAPAGALGCWLAAVRHARRRGLPSATPGQMAQAGAMRGALNWYRAMPLINPRSADAKVSVPTLVWCDGDVAVLRNAAETCHKWAAGPYRFEVLAKLSHWIPDEVPDTVAELLLEQFAACPS